MNGIPSKTPRCRHIRFGIVDEGYLIALRTHTFCRQPKELRCRFRNAQIGRIEDRLKRLAEAKHVAQIGGAPMLLVCGEAEARALLAKTGEIGEQLVIKPGVILKPVIKQCLNRESRGNFGKHLTQARFDRLSSRYDFSPMALKELPLKQRWGKPQIAFEIGRKMQSVVRASVNQYAVNIDHENFHEILIS